MRTITLPPDLEDRLAEEAQRRGTTPELLAVDTLRKAFVPEGYDDGPWDAEELDRLREESVGLLDRYGKDA
jgi:hypothetical protein